MVKNSLFLAYIVLLIASLGSIYASEVVGLEACKLCWTQRAFMFPLPIMLFFIILFQRPDVVGFLLPLPIIGACFSAFHSFMLLTHCDPCSNISWFPFISLGVFLWTIVFFSIALTRDRVIK